MESTSLDTFQIFSIAVGLGCLAAWLTVAVRLGFVAARTRKAPEAAMAGYFGMLSASSLIGIPTAYFRHNGDLERASALSAVALLCFAFGAFALGLGTWRIFRPASRWPAVLIVLLLAEMLTAWWFTVRGGGLVSINSPTVSNLFFAVARLSIYVWAVGEAFAHYTRLRKQIALGLASPLVAQQILLWGTAALFMALSSATIVIRSRVFGAGDETRLSLGVVFILGLTLCATFATWCAFFPPRFMRRRMAAQGA